MYADRYHAKKVSPGSLTMSVGIVGGLLALALASNTVVEVARGDRPFEMFAVPPEPTPPPPDQPPPQAQQQAKAKPRIDQPVQIVRTERPADTHVAPPETGPVIQPGTSDGGGGGAVVVDPPKPPPPVLTTAEVDGRYLRAFQPTYPTAERRAGNEGVVTLKVLIGVDGRVRQVQQIAAASEEFWRVTERQALGRWRFKPATRDGIPVESWRTMTVRFKLNEEG